jgi:DNA-binding SARP family transcriptional activator
MTVIGWNELQLSREECRGVAGARGVALGESELDQLHARTGGWVAGLVLLLQSLPPSAPCGTTQGCTQAYPFRIEALGNFRLTRGGSADANAKRAGRPFDLLKVLVAHGGERVKLDRAAEALWPHVDNDYAIRSLTTALHRLRKELGDDSAVLVKSGELSLSRRHFWLDTWAFAQVSDRAFALASEANTPEQAQALVGAARAALNYCRGTLLADDVQCAWTAAPRERFRSQLLRLLTTVAAVLEKHGMFEDSISLYRQALDSDPLNEALYRRLMISLANARRPHEVSEVYHSCRTLFKAEHQSDPSFATQELYRSLFGARMAGAL